MNYTRYGQEFFDSDMTIIVTLFLDLIICSCMFIGVPLLYLYLLVIPLPEHFEGGLCQKPQVDV